jgi:hypothetical protein
LATGEKRNTTCVVPFFGMLHTGLQAFIAEASGGWQSGEKTPWNLLQHRIILEE